MHTIYHFDIKKITLYYPKSAAMGFFKGTKDQVRISSGKGAISVRATEGLLFIYCKYFFVSLFYFTSSDM